jgi:hypothetical protein
MMGAPPDSSGGAFSMGATANYLSKVQNMNTLDRRQIVRGHVIDVSIAKAAVHESRRERAEAAKKLRKAMAASHFASRQTDTVSYPRHAAV